VGRREAVDFHGRVYEGEKRGRLEGGHLLLGTWGREGWGLMVSEANALGTQAVVYDVPGLRDSTRHLETGYVCERSTPECLTGGITLLWTQPALYEQMRCRSWKASMIFTWSRVAEHFSRFLATTSSLISLA